MKPTIEILGYVVVEPKPNGEPHQLSRRYTIRSAADEYCELMHRNGHPNAYVYEMHGAEGIRGGKRFMRRSGAL